MSKLTNLFLEIISVSHLTAKAEKQRKYKEREREKDTHTHKRWKVELTARDKTTEAGKT